jgi:hypothetical protein
MGTQHLNYFILSNQNIPFLVISRNSITSVVNIFFNKKHYSLQDSCKMLFVLFLIVIIILSIIFFIKIPKKILVSGLITGLIGFSLRYVFQLYIGMDLLDTIQNPIASISYLISLAWIRVFINYIIDIQNFIMLPMNAPGANPPAANPPAVNPPAANPPGANPPAANPPGANPPAANPPGPNPQGFTLTPGFGGYGNFHVSDPTGVGAGGYIDPATNQPRQVSFQPYANNLARAMAEQINEARRNGNNHDYMSFGHFDPTATRFFNEYMQANYPNRSPNNYNNSHSTRTGISRLP